MTKLLKSEHQKSYIFKKKNLKYQNSEKLVISKLTDFSDTTDSSTNIAELCVFFLCKIEYNIAK